MSLWMRFREECLQRKRCNKDNNHNKHTGRAVHFDEIYIDTDGEIDDKTDRDIYGVRRDFPYNPSYKQST
jgi:hypothetical protein